MLQTLELGSEHINEKKLFFSKFDYFLFFRRLHSKEFSIHTY